MRRFAVIGARRILGIVAAPTGKIALDKAFRRFGPEAVTRLKLLHTPILDEDDDE